MRSGWAILGAASLALWRSAESQGPAAAADPWPTRRNYVVLGAGACVGDELIRSVNAMCVIVTGNNLTGIANQCLDWCDQAATTMSRCMGAHLDVETSSCCLFDRDWDASQQGAVRNLVGAGKTVMYVAVQYPGAHLIYTTADASSTATTSSNAASGPGMARCYRRSVSSCAGAPNCASLRRYACNLGKVANTCDICRPRYRSVSPSPGPAYGSQGNTACVPDPNANVPTLRVSFATSTLTTDLGQTKAEGMQAGYLGVAFALKYAWDTGSSIIPIPAADRERFHIEIVGFSENLTIVRSTQDGGTEGASPTLLLPGFMAMAGTTGSSLQQEVQIRETVPPGQPVHAVFGTLADSSTELNLAVAGDVYQRSVIGFAQEDPGLQGKPFYVRSNRVALDPGLAIAKILKQLQYKGVTVFQQVATPRLAGQLQAADSRLAIRVEGPPSTSTGDCTSAMICIRDIAMAWRRIRDQDARIIAHESAGSMMEDVIAAMSTDLFGERTLYIKSGQGCHPIPVYSAVTASSLDLNMIWVAMGVRGNNTCRACSNLATVNVADAARANQTWVAEFLYDQARNSYAYLQPAVCPMFPTIREFLACTYCDVTANVFASPQCEDIFDRMNRSFARAMCIAADETRDTSATQGFKEYLAYLSTSGSTGDAVADGLAATSRLRTAGMPASILEPYEPGGRSWELGLRSTGRPGSWVNFWLDSGLASQVSRTTFADLMSHAPLVDAMLTLIAGYNNFIKYGGDIDAGSQAARPRESNWPAWALWQSMLRVNFTGQEGRVQYLTSGTRNVEYFVYQLLPAAGGTCDLQLQGRAPSTFQRRFNRTSATWNFKTAPDIRNLTAELVNVSSEGCTYFPSGSLVGKAVLLTRASTCDLATRVYRAKIAGAVAVVIWDNLWQKPFLPDAEDNSLTIPGVAIGRDDGLALSSELATGTHVDITITGSTRCSDPENPQTQGMLFYEQTMSYSPLLDTLTIPAGVIYFNDGNTTPPLEAHAPCTRGASYNLTLRTCVPCPLGSYLPQALAPCVVCPGGSFTNVSGSTECSLCPMGTFSEDDSSVCTDCPTGRVAPTFGAVACSPCRMGQYWQNGLCRGCAPGTYQNEEGATSCMLCAVGFFTGELEQSACSACMPGTHQAAHGSTVCRQCNSSSYQPNKSSASCLLCDAVIPGSVAPGTGTMEAAYCQCPRGRYFLRDTENGTGACLECPDGLTCPGGLDSEGKCCEPPTQNARTHAGQPLFPGGPIPFNVWCKDSVKCPAGRALGQCPEHATGRACDVCELGWVFQEKQGRCMSCKEQASFVPLLLTILAAVVLVTMMFLYAARDLSVQSQTLITIALTFALSTNILQVLGTFRELSLDWVEPMKTIYSVLQIFTFKVELLNPSCVFGTSSPELTYTGSLLTHPAFAVALALVFVVVGCLPRPVGRKVSLVQVANAQGLILLMLYISISLVAVLPWQCESNPDGTSSVASYRTVKCWARGKHTVMIGVSAAGIVVYDVGFIALVAWATFSYPAKMRNPGGIDFIRLFHWLFSRFRPNMYFYGLIYCWRNLAIALVPVLFVNNQAAEVLLMVTVVALVAFIQCWGQPWRGELPNYVDALASLGLILILVGGSVLLEVNHADGVPFVQGFFAAILLLVTGVVSLVVVLCTYRLLRPRKQFGIFLSHHKVGAAVLARWFKLVLAEFTSDQIFYDSDDLRELDALFEICAHRTRNVVVLLTRETLRRIWCAGEITSAMRNKVDVILLACNDYVPPSEEFIDGLHSEWQDSQKSEVVQLGVRIEHIQEAYRELLSLPLIYLDRTKAVSDQAVVVHAIFKGCRGLVKTAKGLLGHSTPVLNSSRAASVVLLGAATEAEDRLVAVVISMMLQRQAGMSVSLLDKPQDILQADLHNVRYLMVLLSRGVLDSPAVAATLTVVARQPDITMIPLNFDTAFEFPGAEWYEALVSGKVLTKDALVLSGTPLSKVAAAYKKLFSALSVRFTPHGSIQVQHTEVDEMTKRLAKAHEVRTSRDPIQRTPTETRILDQLEATAVPGDHLAEKVAAEAAFGSSDELEFRLPDGEASMTAAVAAYLEAPQRVDRICVTVIEDYPKWV